MGHDLSGIYKKPILRQLVLGSPERSRGSDEARSNQFAKAARGLFGQRGLQNKSGDVRLDHARLAVRVLHEYNGSLEKAIGECDNPSTPGDTTNLSKNISPFYHALGITLKRGRKPLEGESPFALRDQIRKVHNSATSWEIATKFSHK